jgi:hypothetical protein
VLQKTERCAEVLAKNGDIGHQQKSQERGVSATVSTVFQRLDYFFVYV